MHKDKFKKILIMFYTGIATFLSFHNKVFAADKVDCDGETMKYIREVFTWVKIAIPIILILTGSMDFIKAIVASDDQKMKKAQKDFITRLIVGAVIFFVPSILELLLSMIGIDNACTIG
ncbi:MAG: hypothetical protein IJO57_01225 [Bacilli bacterium]|nr:hypothetical protein [Bacilli bacterium]